MRKLTVYMSEEVYESIRRRAYDGKRSVTAEIRRTIQESVMEPAAAARPAGRDAKRHEAEGARAAKAELPADVAVVDEPALRATGVYCVKCRVRRTFHGSDVCLQCSRKTNA